MNLAEVRRDDRRLVIPPELIADIAAPIMGRPKDEVIGDQLREHRRTMRLARGAVGTLAALTATATVATFIAIGQRNNAQTQARVATSREIAALAIATLGTDTDVAELLAVAAYKTDRNPQTQAALFEAVTASPQLVRYLQAGDSCASLQIADELRTGHYCFDQGRLSLRIAVHLVCCDGQQLSHVGICAQGGDGQSGNLP